MLPTHRLALLPEELTAEALAAKMEASFMVEEVRGGSREVLVGEVLSRMEEQSDRGTLFGCYHPGEDRCFMLTLKGEGLPEDFVSSRPDVLRSLDVVVLSDLLLDRFLGLDHHRCEEEGLRVFQ